MRAVFFMGDCFNILVDLATDIHLGYKEKDLIRSNDSLITFEEILQIATENNVDFILLGGDLFHDNKPSRKVVYQTMNLLREYCFGEKNHKFEFLSDPDDVFRHCKFPGINYNSNHFNVKLPIFSIHGNHDDPVGVSITGLCSLDILSTCGFVNYFGKFDQIEHLDVCPLLFKKRETKLAIYGLGSIRDERLHQIYKEGRIAMLQPEETPDEWFNLMVIHQNRYKRGSSSSSYIPDHMLDSFIDLLVWGHEHECLIEPCFGSSDKFYISQPGSSIATSLEKGEAVQKKVGLLQIRSKSFKLIPIPLQTVRPFVYDEVVLANTKLDPSREDRVKQFLIEKLLEMIEDAKNFHSGNPNQPKLPLIRLKVDYSGGYPIFKNSEFSMDIAKLVANPNNVLLFRKKCSIEADFNVPNEGLGHHPKLSVDALQIEDLIEQFLIKRDNSEMQLDILSSKLLIKALNEFVCKDEKDSIENMVTRYIDEIHSKLVVKFDMNSLEEELKIIRQQLEAKCENLSDLKGVQSEEISAMALTLNTRVTNSVENIAPKNKKENYVEPIKRTKKVQNLPPNKKQPKTTSSKKKAQKENIPVDSFFKKPATQLRAQHREMRFSELIRERLQKNSFNEETLTDLKSKIYVCSLGHFFNNVNLKFPLETNQIKKILKNLIRKLREYDRECEELELISNLGDVLTIWCELSRNYVEKYCASNIMKYGDFINKMNLLLNEEQSLGLCESLEELGEVCDLPQLNMCFYRFHLAESFQFHPIDIGDIAGDRFIEFFPNYNYIICSKGFSPSSENQSNHQLTTTNNPFEIAKWFLVVVTRVLGKDKYSSAAKIFTLVENSELSDEAIQDKLCVLVGWENVELVEQILLKRQQLSVSLNELINYWNSVQMTNSNTTFMNTLHVTSTKRSKQQQLSEKYSRKIRNYIKKLYDKNFNDTTINKFVDIVNRKFSMGKYQNNDASLLTCEEYATELSIETDYQNQLLLYGGSSTERNPLPHVYDTCKYGIGDHVNALPNDTTTKTRENYVELCVPAPTQAPPENTNNFIAINSLSDVEQMVFSNISTLNRIQSIVYKTAIETNENMLICAPTGAGKTNIALLTILREIINNTSSNNVINMSSFKVVYIAPMKALAAEITEKFGRALSCLKIKVRELTGDMKLTAQQLSATQIIVTTPEKWDVVTRKPSGDVSLPLLARLLIIDEVHLLQDERGPVIEAIVARTLRLVESSQSMIRIVGLSATLPNYLDVAQFLCVNPNIGLFFFDGRFRSVPLQQTFIGVTTSTNQHKELESNMSSVCYEKTIQSLRNEHQVMIFVHTRNNTLKTALKILTTAQIEGHIALFNQSMVKTDRSKYNKLQSQDLKKIIESGIGIHHAGIARRDRDTVEALFLAGSIKVLVCTATLSWGINLPAHTVIIKGTDIYDASKGTFVPLNILDVQQIFGRAGRPQFTATNQGEIGHAILITKHKDLDFYVKSFLSPKPIESQLLKTSLVDVINSEVALGTITNLSEAIKWLKYTYLFVRMIKNPLVYGATNKQIKSNLLDFEKKIVMASVNILNKNKMIRFDNCTEYLYITNLGRIASHFYLTYSTIAMLNENFNSMMDVEQLFRLICKSSEFSSIILRLDETIELASIPSRIRRIGTSYSREIIDAEDKIMTLLQCHISRHRPDSFSLVSDMNYISQNCGRIARAFFEIALANDWPSVAIILHEITKAIQLQVWMDDHPLEQFADLFNIPSHVMKNIVKSKLSMETIRELSIAEVGAIIRNKVYSQDIVAIAKSFPLLNVRSKAQPITNSILSIKLYIKADFHLNERIIGSDTLYWIMFVEDLQNDHIFHHEIFTLSKKQVITNNLLELNFYIPIFEPVPSQYTVRFLSETFLGAECIHHIDFNHYLLPQLETIHTNLLDIQPLPIDVIKNELYHHVFKFSYFNPLQSQVFHTLYHTDNNVLIGAPTGSGKTIVAEFAMLRLFDFQPNAKVVYVGPMKSLVRERYTDWKKRYGDILYKKVVELTGEAANDKREISTADIIVTTPEKWDGLSRSWKTREYVKSVKLIIFDEIHLLGESRGAVLEAIVARINSIEKRVPCSTSKSASADVILPKNDEDTVGSRVRLVALSTSTANSLDLARWLGVKEVGLFNFRPSVRPIPLEVHISGFPGDKYNPRMNSMNKSVFEAIKTHSPSKPVLIFASSRRQTKRTAMALISLVSLDDNSKQWLKLPEQDIINLASTLVDENLKLFLPFGVAIHHAGLDQNDRKVVEELFLNQKIQILIATSTVAWGVNFPAHLVVIKGTEYYFAKTKQYVDFPITDVLQMMGRAGRPQFDTHGVAVILVQDTKKHFYKRFLYEPFPIESHLLDALPDHINAEVVSGMIRHKNDAFVYLNRTYLYQRLSKNPTYYGIEGSDMKDIVSHLDMVLSDCFETLEKSYCVHKNEGKLYDQGEQFIYTPTSYGRVASFYYISHKTVKLICDTLRPDSTIEQLLSLVASSCEFDEFPVRHNEDDINAELSKHLPLCYLDPRETKEEKIKKNKINYGDSHVKAHLLFQAHFARIKLPISDYETDSRSLLDQSIRIIQAIIDISSFGSMLSVTLQSIILLQCVINGCWWYDSSLLSLPLPSRKALNHFNISNRQRNSCKTYELCELIEMKPNSSILTTIKNRALESDSLECSVINKVFDCLMMMPKIDLHFSLCFQREDNSSEKVYCENSQNSKHRSNTFTVKKGMNYFVDVKLYSNIQRSKENFILNDRFSKPKDICWFLCVGDASKNKLYVMKRISSFTKKIHTTLNLGVWDNSASDRHTFQLYLMCDAIFGLDQQYEFHLITSTDSNPSFI